MNKMCDSHHESEDASVAPGAAVAGGKASDPEPCKCPCDCGGGLKSVARRDTSFL